MGTFAMGILLPPKALLTQPLQFAVGRFGRRAIESGCRTHSGSGAGDWCVELLEDGGLREEWRRVRCGWPSEDSGWTLQVGGPAVDCARAGPEYPRSRHGMAGSRTLP